MHIIRELFLDKTPDPLGSRFCDVFGLLSAASAQQSGECTLASARAIWTAGYRVQARVELHSLSREQACDDMDYWSDWEVIINLAHGLLAFFWYKTGFLHSPATETKGRSYLSSKI